MHDISVLYDCPQPWNVCFPSIITQGTLQSHFNILLQWCRVLGYCSSKSLSYRLFFNVLSLNKKSCCNCPEEFFSMSTFPEVASRSPVLSPPPKFCHHQAVQKLISMRLVKSSHTPQSHTAQ